MDERQIFTELHLQFSLQLVPWKDVKSLKIYHKELKMKIKIIVFYCKCKPNLVLSLLVRGWLLRGLSQMKVFPLNTSLFIDFIYTSIQGSSDWGHIRTKPEPAQLRSLMFLRPLLVEVVHWLLQVLPVVHWEQSTALCEGLHQPQALQCINNSFSIYFSALIKEYVWKWAKFSACFRSLRIKEVMAVPLLAWGQWFVNS